MSTAQRMFGLAVLAAGVLHTAEGLIPFDGRWHYPHYLNFRPGDGQVCEVNPPRFSWSYLPGTVTTTNPPLQTFRFQLSRNPDFAAPDFVIDTELNFYNALPVLENTTWHWRVGYGIGSEDEIWSATRSFTFSEHAVLWDRTILSEAAARLAARPRPRLAPPGGDWHAWRETLAADPNRAAWLEAVLAIAERATNRPWWGDFPTTDRRDEAAYDDQAFANIARELAVAAFAYRLTGEERYLTAKDHAVALARFPIGGLASPEYHGPRRKWATQITEFLALVHDWLHPELTAEERGIILHSIDWRLHATYRVRNSWRGPEAMPRQSVAVFGASHPYENFMWSLPAVLLCAGDSETADQLVDVCLHYLTGVTSAHGPDEGWNEGLAYGGWKGLSMLQAAMTTELLLPELRLGDSPYFRRLGEWYAHLYPIGIQRLAFGDYARNPERQLPAQRNIFRHLARLTGDGRMQTRADALVAEVGDGLSARPWLDLLAKADWQPPEPQPERTRALFAEAGWVMVSNQPPSSRAAFQDAVGMIFQCRPRGGYSHSFRAENDFVWHAYGQALSAGGGNTAYPDPHARHSMSHNVILIDGVGQEWTPRLPEHPFCGRLLLHREGEGFVHWVGDATRAYQTLPGLRRWHRHVVFVDDAWFAVFDDLAMQPDADPARFSWLFHVAPEVPLNLEPAAIRYRIENVHARVALANRPESIHLVNRRGRDGFVNEITGEDMFEAAEKALADKGRSLPEDSWMNHNIRATNREPARTWTFLAGLTAWREGQPEPQVEFPSENAIRVAIPDGNTRIVSFDPAIPGDIHIDLSPVHAHAQP